MKRKYEKFGGSKTIPECAIVACRPFYDVDFFDRTESGLCADVFTQSGPGAVVAKFPPLLTVTAHDFHKADGDRGSKYPSTN